MKRYTLTDTFALNDYLSEDGSGFVSYRIRTDASPVLQLRSCQAWMIPCEMVDCCGDVWYGYLLQSYHTIVAFACINQDLEIVTCRLGKWSTTTSRQQTWFCNEAPLYKVLNDLTR